MPWSTIAATLALLLTPLCQAATLRGLDASDVVADSTNVTKFTDAQFTWYNVGLGACGKTNVASDFVASLNVQQYGPSFNSPACFKTIVLTWGGKTTQATIVDECPTCPYKGLDLSQGLFAFFAPLDDGLLSNATWWFTD